MNRLQGALSLGGLLASMLHLGGLSAHASSPPTLEVLAVSSGPEHTQWARTLTAAKKPSWGWVFRWFSPAGGVRGVRWRVAQAGRGGVIAEGKQVLDAAVLPGGGSTFEVSHPLLSRAVASPPRKYFVTVRALGAQEAPEGPPSAPVTIVHDHPPAETGPSHLGNAPLFPKLKLVRYTPPSTTSAGELRVSAYTSSDEVRARVVDRNGLVRSTAKVFRVIHDAKLLRFALQPVMPKPIGASNPDQLWTVWRNKHHQVGVDLRIELEAVGKMGSRTWSAFAGTKDSCQDGRRNGAEQGVDCGPICQRSCCTCGPNVPKADWRRRNGFSFGNTAAFQHMVGGYDLGDLQGVFGDCAIYGPGCVPIPTLQAVTFLTLVNGVLDKGQCFGMSLASLRFARKHWKLDAYPSWNGKDPTRTDANSCSVWHLGSPKLGEGGEANRALAPNLVRDIHRQHLLQLSNEGMNAALFRHTGSVADIAARVKAERAVIVSMHAGGAGHAVVVYDVRQVAAGHVLDLYNPNAPWTPMVMYDAADPKRPAMSTGNPNQILIREDGTYTFQDGSMQFSGKLGAFHEGLSILPYATYSAPTMPGNIAAPVVLGTISGSGGPVQVTDADGRTLLDARGRVNRDVATMSRKGRWYAPGSARRPIFVGRSDTDFTFALRGANAAKAVELTLLAPGLVARLRGYAAEQDRAELLRLSPRNKSVTLRTSRGKAVDLELTHIAADRSERSAQIGVTLPAAGALKLSFAPDGRTVRVRSSGGKAQLRVRLRRGTDEKRMWSLLPVDAQPGEDLELTPEWRDLAGRRGVLVRTRAGLRSTGDLR